MSEPCACQVGGSFRPACTVIGGCGSLNDDTECGVCTKPTRRPEALVCDPCIDKAIRHLRELHTPNPKPTDPQLLEQLEVTIAKQDRVARHGAPTLIEGQVSVRRAEAFTAAIRVAPLPINIDASELHHTISRTLITGAAQVMRDQHQPQPGPRITADQAITYLQRERYWFRRNPNAAGVIDWLRMVTGKIRRTIDRPADLMYAGTCGWPVQLVGIDETSETDVVISTISGRCGAELFAEFDQTTVRCPSCEHVHEVAHRRVQILDAANDTLLPIDVILHALPTMIGIRINKSTARNWRRDRKAVPALDSIDGRPARKAIPYRPRVIWPHSTTDTGVELYKVSEVIDLAKQTNLRAVLRKAQRDIEALAAVTALPERTYS